MSNQTVKRDFKNGSTHWLRYWPILAFLLVQTVGITAAWATGMTSMRSETQNLKTEFERVRDEQAARRQNVYAIPRLQDDISELKSDVRGFMKEQRQVNQEILRSIRSQ